MQVGWTRGPERFCAGRCHVHCRACPDGRQGLGVSAC